MMGPKVTTPDRMIEDGDGLIYDLSQATGELYDFSDVIAEAEQEDDDDSVSDDSAAAA